MSLEQLHDKNINPHQLRVITLHSKEPGQILMRHDLALPSGNLARSESFDRAARRIAQEAFYLDGMKSVAHVPYEDVGISGQVIEAAHGNQTDLRRSFAARAIDLSTFLDDNADSRFDPIDLALIRSYAGSRIAPRMLVDKSAKL